jgi:ABC-type glycerol-3-phosphate transport system substrate-binding protein
MVDTEPHDGGSGVSRRSFVKAAGASGVAVGLAGCVSTGGGSGGSGDGGSGDGGSGGSTDTPISTEEVTDEVTIQWAADTRVANNSEAIKEALTNAGLPDNITVEILAGSQVTDNRQSQYQQWLSAGRQQPTLMMMDSGWTIPFIARNQIQNLSSALPDDMVTQVEEDYFQASVNTAMSPGGDLYGVPLFPDFPTMQYRKDLLRNAGYSDSDFQTWATESMSWAEFSQVTKQAMDANPDIQYGYTFQANVYEGLSCCDFNEFMTSWGGAYFGNPEENLFGPIGDRPITVDEEAVLQSIRMVRKFIHGSDDPEALGSDYAGGIAPEAVLQWTEEPSRKPFTNGDAIMHRNWPYSIVINGAGPDAENPAFGEDLGVMPIPYGVTAEEAEYPMTGGPVAALGGWHMTMNPNATSQSKQAAVQVLRAMMTESFKLDMFQIIGWIPPEPALLDSSEASEVDVIGRYLQQLKVAGENAIPRPVTVVWPQQSGRIASRVNAAYAREQTPEDAMSELKSQLQQIENSA